MTTVATDSAIGASTPWNEPDERMRLSRFAKAKQKRPAATLAWWRGCWPRGATKTPNAGFAKESRPRSKGGQVSPLTYVQSYGNFARVRRIGPHWGPCTRKNSSDAREHQSDLRPRHDMRSVCTEYRFNRNRGPIGIIDVENQRWHDVDETGICQPLIDASMVLPPITRVPNEMRQLCGEIHSMLACAAADFQHASAGAKFLFQHFEDRRLIAIAGVGRWLHDLSRCCPVR